MKGNKGFKIFLISSAALLFTFLMGYAGVPQLINFEGTLKDAGGNPVPDGSYDVEFNIYDSPSVVTALWTEVWNGNTSRVATRGGMFNVQLGTHNPIPLNFFKDHPNAYLGIKVGLDHEMIPRQRITSVAYAFTAGTGGIPSGGIIMWHGSADDIPEGWALCDGENGTPDLRDRFIVGAGNAYTAKDTGGVKENTLSHTHTISSENLAAGAAGNHNHYVQGDLYNQIGDTTDGAEDGNKDVACENHGHRLALHTDAGGNHSHSINAHNHSGSTGPELTTPIDNRPPFYALCLIMKL